ncbi:MAG: hypothetical protein ACI8UO_005678 [Verrucomicrobiales bacterium]|jgi:hypothetical protein
MKRKRLIPISLVAAFLIGAGVFAWFGVDHHFVPAYKPRKSAREHWLALTNPPLIQDAPKVSFAADQIEIERTGSNLKVNFPSSAEPEDEFWQARVDEVIRGSRPGVVELGDGQKITVTHIVIRYALNENGLEYGGGASGNCWTGVFQIPGFRRVVGDEIPADIRERLSGDRATVNQIDTFVRIQFPESVLELRSPILVDRNLEMTISAAPAWPVTPTESGAAVVWLPLSCWHAAETELWTTVVHQATEPLILDPKRGSTGSIPEAGLDVRLLLAESVGFYTPSGGTTFSGRDGFGSEHLKHTRYNLSTSAVHSEPHVRQDRFFHTMIDDEGALIRSKPSMPLGVSPWKNPFLLHVAERRMEFVKKIRITYSQRIDRVSIPIGILPLPGKGNQNLLDFEVPYAQFDNREEALKFLAYLSGFELNFKEPGHLKLIPKNRQRHQNLTIHGLLELIETPTERVVIDAEAEEIRMAPHDAWHRRAWQKIQRWFPGQPD